MLKASFSYLLIILLAGAEAFAAPPPRALRAGEYSLDASSEYFFSEANYGAGGGNYADLPNGGSYSHLSVRAGGRYFWLRQLEVGGHGSLGWAQSDDGNFQRDNSEITDITPFLRYYMKFAPALWILDLSADFPVNSIDPDTDQVMTGEGVIALKPALWLKAPFLGLNNYAKLGFTYRMGGRSSLLPWAIGSEWRGEAIVFSAELNGYQSVIDDEDAAAPGARTFVNNRVNGGSLRYYAVNPSLMSAELRAGWLHPAFEGYLSLAQTLNGDNNAHGLMVALQLVLPFGSKSTATMDMSSPPTLRDSQQDDGFRVEGESYDESLFEENSPRRPKRKVRSKEELDKMMKETEKSLSP